VPSHLSSLLQPENSFATELAVINVNNMQQ